jgi:hypothetical protein
MIKDAVISECGTYRYKLRRRWGEGAAVCFIMLNPSTADASIDDPTIRKCVGFAKLLGYEQLDVVNLFAYRSTDPSKLRMVPDPIGVENNRYIMSAVESCAAVICAWGAGSPIEYRGPWVQKVMLKRMGITPLALKVTKGGHPAHPLYLPYTCTPKEF